MQRKLSDEEPLMKAVVMAGGFGTPLRPLTCNLPKPMVPMDNRPMMEHILTLLEKHQFNDLICMLYFSPDDIRGYFQDGKKFDVKMKYLVPTGDLGTAGCVKFAEEDLDETFVVMSGDVLTDFDLTDALKFHKEKKSLATLVLTRVTNPLQYGVVIIDESGRVTRFLEKPSWGEVFSDTINTGIYILDPKVLAEIPPDQTFDFSKDLFPKLLAEKKPLYGYVASGYWKDVGDLREYRLAHGDILEGKVSIKIHGKSMHFVRKDQESYVWADKDMDVQDGVEFFGNSIIGKSCKIEAGSRIENSVIGEGCVIGANAQVSGSILWKGVKVGRETVVREAVIGERTTVGDNCHIQVGATISDDCVIGTGAQIRANVKVWPHKIIEDGSVLATSLIWAEKWSRSLFGAYGISGLGNIEVTPEFAAKVGAAYGAYLGKETYVITSRDAHRASRMIKRAFISGLLSSGVRVGDLRTSPAPVMRYEMGKEGEDGGVHVRVSPFSGNLIDIKIFNKNGSDISVLQEKSIEQLFLREDFKRASLEESGELQASTRSQEYYRAGFLKTINKELIRQARFKVVLDYAYSSASMVFPAILGDLGIEVVALNSYLSPQKITKTEKEFQHSLDQLSNIVTTLKADIGFLIDNGAEKLFIVDERGRILPEHQALAAVCFLAIQCLSPGTLAVPVTETSVIEMLAAKGKMKVTRTPTMPRHIMNAARTEGVRFVGDGIGGYIFPEFHCSFDSMYAIAKILEMLAQRKAKIGHVVREIPYKMDVQHRKIPCPWDKKGQVMRLAVENLKEKNLEVIDGIKLKFKDSWVLMIPDPDEAYFHLWVEAEDERKVRDLLRDYSEKIVRWMS